MSDRNRHDPGDEDRSTDLYCDNCGDPFDLPSAEDPVFVDAFRRWRSRPNPSPGRPLIDCGIGDPMVRPWISLLCNYATRPTLHRSATSGRDP
jgi:hypothetical protein